MKWVRVKERPARNARMNYAQRGSQRETVERGWYAISSVSLAHSLHFSTHNQSLRLTGTIEQVFIWNKINIERWPTSACWWYLSLGNVLNISSQAFPAGIYLPKIVLKNHGNRFSYYPELSQPSTVLWLKLIFMLKIKWMIILEPGFGRAFEILIKAIMKIAPKTNECCILKLETNRLKFNDMWNKFSIKNKISNDQNEHFYTCKPPLTISQLFGSKFVLVSTEFRSRFKQINKRDK